MPRRPVLVVLFGVAVLCVALLSTLQIVARPLPPPDPTLPIHLPDGSQRPLGELLAALAAGEELPRGPLPTSADAASDAIAPSSSAPPSESAPPDASSAAGDAPPPPLTIVQHDPDGSTELRFEFPPDWQERVRAGWRALGPLYELGMLAESEGRTDEAIALLLSIPEGDRAYARACRYVGWNLLTQQQQRPEQAIGLVQQSLASNPFDGNAWQDAGRVYLQALGIDAD